jgi:hypothetical protein
MSRAPTSGGRPTPTTRSRAAPAALRGRMTRRDASTGRHARRAPPPPGGLRRPPYRGCHRRGDLRAEGGTRRPRPLGLGNRPGKGPRKKSPLPVSEGGAFRPRHPAVGVAGLRGGTDRGGELDGGRRRGGSKPGRSPNDDANERFAECRSNGREPRNGPCSQGRGTAGARYFSRTSGAGAARLRSGADWSNGASAPGRGALRRRPAGGRRNSFSPPKEGPPRCGCPAHRPSGALPASSRGNLPAAPPLHGGRSGQAVALVQPAHPGRGHLPHGQVRHRPAAGRSPETDRGEAHQLLGFLRRVLGRSLESGRSGRGPRRPCSKTGRIHRRPPLHGPRRALAVRRAHARTANGHGRPRPTKTAPSGGLRTAGTCPPTPRFSPRERTQTPEAGRTALIAGRATKPTAEPGGNRGGTAAVRRVFGPSDRCARAEGLAAVEGGGRTLTRVRGWWKRTTGARGCVGTGSGGVG